MCSIAPPWISRYPGRSGRRDADGNVISIAEAFQNSGSQKARGADFGLNYQLQSRFGTVTWVTQATYLDSFQFAEVPSQPERELRSGIRDVSDEGYLKWRANSQIDWAWNGFDVGLTAHYLDGFHEILNVGPQFTNGIKEHWVKQTWFFDVRASYTFHFVPPIEGQAVAGYSKDAKGVAPKDNAITPTVNYALPIWKHLVDDTTIKLGCNNAFGHDPPDAAANENYADFLYDSTGRFVYASLTKKFYEADADSSGSPTR